MRFSIILLVCMFFSCESDDSGSTALDRSIDLLVTNNIGDNLLDPNNPDSFKEEDIQLFYLIDGVAEMPVGGSKHPKNFYIMGEEEDWMLRLYANDDKSEEYPITFLQWNETNTDTLRFHFIHRSNSTVWDEMWYNEVNYQYGTVIHIVK